MGKVKSKRLVTAYVHINIFNAEIICAGTEDGMKKGGYFRLNTSVIMPNEVLAVIVYNAPE